MLVNNVVIQFKPGSGVVSAGRLLPGCSGGTAIEPALCSSKLLGTSYQQFRKPAAMSVGIAAGLRDYAVSQLARTKRWLRIADTWVQVCRGRDLVAMKALSDP